MKTAPKVLCLLSGEFGISNIILFSSVAIYGESEETTTDDSVPNPTNDNDATKLAAESLSIEWQQELPMRCAIILYPALEFGEGNEANMFRLFDQINSGNYFQVSEGRNKKSIGYVLNLVGTTEYLYDHIECGLHIYNCADEP